MKKVTAGMALLLAIPAMTAACTRHDDSANATTNEVVADETVANGSDDNLSTADTLDNATDANAEASANGA